MSGVGASRCTLAALLFARAAAGEPASATRPPEEPGQIKPVASEALTRPHLKSELSVEYPSGETEHARVVLELVITREGSVSETKVVEGREPFAAAAVEAARGAAFEPARRKGQPIPARIRIEVRFTPPTPEPTPPPESPEVAPPPGKKPAKVIEVVVLGERTPPGRSSLGKAEIRELPGAFGDPFRAVEVFPGVTPIFSGVPFFYVRGSPPGNVGYFLDGVRVPLLFHVALGPSVIHPGLVDRVDIYPGGYPARYGRYAGAIVSGETTAPRQEFRGEANVRLFDAGALAAAPFAEGRGNALIGGRYSYTAAILSLLAPEVTLTYWDYQARVGYALSPKWRLSAFSFGAFDLFRADEEDSSVGTQFHRVDLRLDHVPDPKTKLRIAVMAGLDLSAAQTSEERDDEEAPKLQDQLAGARLEYERQLDERTKLRAGADVNLDRYRIVDVPNDDGFRAQLFFTRDDITTGARADLVWEPERGIVVTPGLRADLYISGRKRAFALEPRLAAEFEINRRVRLEHAIGLAQQAPSFVVPVPGFSISDLGDGLQRSLQSSAGVIVRPGSEFQLGLTLFHSAFFQLTDFLGTTSFSDQISGELDDPQGGQRLEDELDRRALGQAYGLELSIKRPLTQRLGGFLAYTLSRTTRSIGRVRGRPASFDRTHVLHAALSLNLGKGYRAGARVSTYTGVPAQMEANLVRDVAPSPASGTGGASAETARVRAAREGPRSPLFYRVDVRFEKRWPIDRRGRYIAFVAEMLNATLKKETPFLTCDSDGCEGEPIGPVSIPSIGAEVFF